MNRILKIHDGINLNKYRFLEEYDGYALYQHITPSGCPISNEYALIDLGCGDEQLPIVIQSFNGICKDEILDAIDHINNEGVFGWRALYKPYAVVVHPNGDRRI